MIKDVGVFIGHIEQCIALIEEYLQGKTKENFIHSTQLQDSVIRRIEIIGEAVKNIHPDIRNRYTNIPWKKIAGMRDILIHEYFGLDLDLTWEVIARDIPQLKKEIKKIKL